MARAKATHMRSGKLLAEDLEVERSLLGRTAGLMFRRSLAPGAGMWIVPCNGIHMMFMNFAIDAVFLDRQNRVKKVYPRLPAWWGVVWIEWGAHSVLELPAGSTAALGLLSGDEISIVS
jgi:uncharacterized membrane protein (UPF0127 family)